jgi:hypothetical protein
MSRSNPTLTNPAQHFMSWAGSTGTLSWYDKDKAENVNVPLPFEFLVLDQLATIKGYNKATKVGYWSNEVRSIRKEQFTIHTKQGVVYTGFYKDDQGNVLVPRACEYTQSVYIAYKDGENWTMGNINMKGSSRSAWFDFTRTCNVEDGKITITKGAVQTAQTGDFYPPVFTWSHSNGDEDKMASSLDRVLQTYLSQYLAPKVEDEEKYWPSDQDQIDPNLGRATPEQIAEFEHLKAAKKVDTHEDDEAVQTYIDNSQSFDGEPLPEFPGDV